MLSESMKIYVLVLEILIAFLITFLLTPHLIKTFMKKGITGIDVHKIEKPTLAKMCGLSVVIGFTAALIYISLLLPFNASILATVATVLLSALIGVYDDLHNLRQRHKVLLLLLAAAPIAWTLRNRSTISFPLIGVVDLGLLFPFLLVPIGVSAAANLTNMLAGFNGLEASLGSLSLGAVAVSALIIGSYESLIIALPMAVALCSFLFFNWYPAKAFPGDAGTLAIGSSLACAVIVGKIEMIGVCVLTPHIIDFFVKLLDSGRNKPFNQRFQYGDTKISQDGILHPPPYFAFTHLIMRLRPMTEKRLVKAIVLCEVFFSIVAITLSIGMI